jgi:hypothetical protein
MSSHRSSERHLNSKHTLAGVGHKKQLAPVTSTQGASQLSGMGTVPHSPLGMMNQSVIGEEHSSFSDQMAKIKQEFVEYVKEILTKTTSQVSA